VVSRLDRISALVIGSCGRANVTSRIRRRLVVGTIFFYGTCWWLTYPMIRYAHIRAWLAYPLFLLPTFAAVIGAYSFSARRPSARRLARAHGDRERDHRQCEAGAGVVEEPIAAGP